MLESNTHTRQYTCLNLTGFYSMSPKLKTKAQALSHIICRKEAKEDLLEIQWSCWDPQNVNKGMLGKGSETLFWNLNLICSYPVSDFLKHLKAVPPGFSCKQWGSKFTSANLLIVTEGVSQKWGVTSLWIPNVNYPKSTKALSCLDGTCCRQG